jgi:hypothetical protein
VHQLVVGDAGAEGVDARERALEDGAEQQLGDPGGPALIVCEPVLVGAPVDDVDRPLALLELREQAPAANRQLLGENQREAQRWPAMVACS